MATIAPTMAVLAASSYGGEDLHDVTANGIDAL